RGLAAPAAAPKLTITHQGRTKLQVRVTGASTPFWLVLGESQNAGWRAEVSGVGSLGGSKLVDGFANGWRIDPAGHQTLTVDLEWMPQRRVRLAIFLSVLGALLCCAIAAAGFRRAQRPSVAFAGAGAFAGGTDATPTFSWPWQPAGEPVGMRAVVLTTVAGAALGALVVGAWAGVLVGAGLLVAFRVPRARAVLALAPPFLVGAIGLYIAYRQYREALPPVFEWPILSSRASTPAWAAIVLFSADALYELVRRARRNGTPEARAERDRDPPVA
ncbi:MAG: arabinofuranan 3-O-arabinosyltransferase, partial [Gaiellaceae bacterium]|nr:arabinofuranan 3-O-arabinosyltransferase [Gaiellaceae bacterium]